MQSYSEFMPTATAWRLSSLRVTPEKTGFQYEYRLSAAIFDEAAAAEMYVLARIIAAAPFKNVIRFALASTTPERRVG